MCTSDVAVINIDSAPAPSVKIIKPFYIVIASSVAMILFLFGSIYYTFPASDSETWGSSYALLLIRGGELTQAYICQTIS